LYLLETSTLAARCGFALRAVGSTSEAALSFYHAAPGDARAESL